MQAAIKKFKKGDKVLVIAGKDKGKQGEIIQVLTEKKRVRVSGAGLVKRHERSSQMSAGGIIEKESSIAISNVSHIDPKTGEKTRIGFKFLEDGKKVRFAKKSGEVMDS